MKTKMKLFVLGAALLGGIGIAAAQTPPAQGAGNWSAKKAEKLAKYDTNKDGKLDDQERAVMRDEFATKRFEKLDTNKDGQLSLAEFKAGQMKHARGGMHHHKRAKKGNAQ